VSAHQPAAAGQRENGVVTSPLHILLLEDDASDAELIQDLLAEHFACEVARVQTRAEFVAALKDTGVDLIHADYKLPSFDGLSALHLARTERSDVPFIFVSGTVGEDVAIEALKIGATDYVVKQRLSRLVPSVQRALRESRERAERRKVGEALRRSEMYLAEAQRLSHTGSFGWNVTSGEIYWSEETYQIFEYETTRKPTVQTVIDRTHPGDRMHVRQVIERASIKGVGFDTEHRLMMPNGSVKHVQVVARRAPGEGAESALLIGAVIDVTERKQAEETLREQADLINLTHDAILIRDMNGVVRNWNRGAEALYGWTAEEAKGKIALDLLKTVFPIPFERVVTELLDRGRWEGELVRARKDGTQVVVASRWSLQRDGAGVPIGALETNNDITEHKCAEEQRGRLHELERDLARLNRVSIMGELAASLAHEIKQPIAGVALNAEAGLRWIRREPPGLEQAGEALSRIINVAKRATSIVDRNCSLYSRGKPQREPTDLNDIIREMAVMLRDAASRHGVLIRSDLDPALPTTTGDRVQLQQVLMNLMLNGIEAMQEGSGELSVTSRRTQDGQLLVSVSDCGIGFPGENLEHIFEAFYTTKPQGTGMGLSISRRIIESHGGRLWASANAGRGATFQFTLPNDGP
jgi:PAS domain S-box-containing protein